MEDFKDGIYYGQTFTQPYFTDGGVFGAARLFWSRSDIDRLDYLFRSGRITLTHDALESFEFGSGDMLFDLIINRASFTSEEFTKLQPFIGETFGQTFFGSMVPTLTVGGHLLETYNNKQKKAFTEWYREAFRINACAHNKIAPSLLIKDTIYKLGLFDMSLSENGNNSEIIDVSFNSLVFSVYQFDGSENSKGAFQSLEHSYFDAPYGITATRAR